MNTESSLKILFWFFGFFVYLAVISVYGAKSANTVHSKRKESKWRDVIYLGLIFIPILAIVVYFIIKDKLGVAGFVIFIPIVLSLVFLICIEYLFNKPTLKKFIAKANDLYANLKVESQESRLSYDPILAKIILDNDAPSYIKGFICDFFIDRICKNSYGEYFWVRASVKGRGFFQSNVKHLTTEGAKNLLREHRDVYLQEFNEEPYYKSK